MGLLFNGIYLQRGSIGRLENMAKYLTLPGVSMPAHNNGDIQAVTFLGNLTILKKYKDFEVINVGAYETANFKTLLRLPQIVSASFEPISTKLAKPLITIGKAMEIYRCVQILLFLWLGDLPIIIKRYWILFFLTQNHVGPGILTLLLHFHSISAKRDSKYLSHIVVMGKPRLLHFLVTGQILKFLGHQKY